MRLLSCTAPYLLLPLFYFLGGASASAQIVNIERGRIDRDSSGYYTGTAGLNFSLFNRNAGANQPNNFLQLTFTGDVAYEGEKHTIMLLNYLNYLLVNYDTPEQRNTVAQTGYTHLRTTLFRQRQRAYELFAQVQADKARGLELRTLTGAYLRYRVYRDEARKVSVFFGVGPMHEHEEWLNPGQEGQMVVADFLKATHYLSARFKPSATFESNAIVYYQVGYDQNIAAFRNRVSGDVGLSFKMSRAVSFRVNFNCAYEDKPVVPVTRFIYAATNGINVAF